MITMPSQGAPTTSPSDSPSMTTRVPMPIQRASRSCGIEPMSEVRIARPWLRRLLSCCFRERSQRFVETRSSEDSLCFSAQRQDVIVEHFRAANKDDLHKSLSRPDRKKQHNGITPTRRRRRRHLATRYSSCGLCQISYWIALRELTLPAMNSCTRAMWSA
jgi:hypothetical protein